MPADFQPAELEHQRAFLQRLARQLVRGEAAAEDLVQDAFVRALERPPESGAALRAWLERVLRRLAINRGRGAQRSTAREHRAARPEALPSHAEALASLEQEERLIAAVKALDEPYRTTLWLRFHSGLAPGAIAAQLDTTKKTVESRITRGLALLRVELDRRSGGDRMQWLGGMLLLARNGNAPWTTTLIGVAMMKKIALAVGVLFVLGVAWKLAPRPRTLGMDAPESLARGEELPRSPALAPPVVVERTALEPETTPATTADARGALRILVRWSDGEPAPGVGLFLRPEDDPRGARALQRLRSDADGIARAAAIHPGSVRIEADRGGERRVTVSAEVETEVVFELSGALDVEGTVSDAAGAPISGAEVLLMSETLDWVATRVVAHTSASGAYRVRCVQPELSVSARAGGFAPALLQRLYGRTGTVRIDFVLDRPGAGLRGIVTDPDGRPVAGARVAVGDPWGHAEEDPGNPGQYLMARGGRVEETDEHGQFFAAGVLTGFGLSVAVEAESYPIAVANVSAEEGATSFVEIALAPPATLAGVVRTSAGAPAPGVELAAILCDGAGANEIPFALPETVSDGEGRFRLELLPRTFVLRLEPPDGLAAGHGLVSFELSPGETRRDIVLPADNNVRGRVEAPAGTLLDGWFVLAHDQLFGAMMKREVVLRAPVGADGRFEIADCTWPPYRVELYAAPDRPVLRRDDVGPGPELVLVAEALGSIQGEFEPAAGLVPEGERPDIQVALREFVCHAPTWDEKGRFAFELLRAGRYRLTIAYAQRPLFASWVELAPGEHVDLGRLTSSPPGSLAVKLDPHPGTSVSGTVLDDGFGEVAGLELVDGRLGVPALPAGEWFLDLNAESCGRICAPFSIRSGERTELVLAPVPGVERSIGFRLDGSEWNALTVELRDARGGLVLARRILKRYSPRAGAGPSLLVSLPVGTFLLEAETDTGLALRTSLDVPTLEPQDSPLVFELR